MKVRQIFTLIVLFLTTTVVAFGQKTITGTVTDADTKEPLVGAAITIKGTSKGTLADINGAYSLDVPSGATTLMVSFVGYSTKEMTIGSETKMDVQLTTGVALDNVVVLGSRAPGRTNTQSAVPVDVITPKDLKGFAQIDLGQILNYVAPSFNSNRQTVADGTDHVDPASLRGLGPDQVLVLVNGKRRHTSALININGTVGRGSVGTDMNVIPVAAIERIEVLRDGAAAQYGSDAIAGVINVVLKKDMGGLAFSMTAGSNNTNLKYSQPNIAGGTDSYNNAITDGQVYQFDLSKGFKLGKEGRLMIAAQYSDRAKTNRSGIDNVPTNYLGANGGFPGTPAGLNQDSFRKALLVNDANLSKTNNYDRHNMVFGNSTAKNMGIFMNGAVPIDGDAEFYFSGGLTSRTGEGFGNFRLPVARNQQPLNSDGTLTNPNGFLPGIRSTIGDQSLILGMKRSLGEWKMDLSNVYGANQFQFEVFNSGNASLPNTSPQQSVFDAGKLKFNQNTTNFDIARTYDKIGALEGLSTAFGAEYRTDNYEIVAGENNSWYGNGRTVPAAPLTIGGAANGSTVAAPGAQVFPGYQPTNALDVRRSSLGVYADFEGEIAQRVLLGVAGRYEDYTDFGNNFSGKIAGRIKIVEGISLRGSFSTGFRAPSLQQRYFNNTSTQFVSGLPSNTLTVNNDAQIARIVIGVDALRPETSVNSAFGVTAKFSNALSLTVDAYQIDIKDRIVYSGAFSRGLLGFAATDYVGVNNVNFFANAANTKTQGVDIVANSKLPVGKGFLNMTAAINFNNNEVTSVNSTALINDPAKNDPAKSPDTRFQNLLFDRQQRSRIEVWQPKNKINLSFGYSLDKLNVTLRIVRFGEAKYVHNLDTETINPATNAPWGTIYSRDASGKAFIDQTFNPVYITDLIVGYNFTKELGISIGANNLLDIYPDQIYIDPRNAQGSIDYNAGRDASNRGRLLFQPNQGGYNGRFIYGRLTFTLK